MKKATYYAKVHYKWRTVRYVKGVEKKSKTWNKSSHETCVIETEPKELEKVKYFMSRLKLKHKSTNDIEIKIDRVDIINYMCMSNDVY